LVFSWCRPEVLLVYNGLRSSGMCIELHVKSLVPEIEEMLKSNGLTPVKVWYFDPHDHPHGLLGKMYLDLHKQFLRLDPMPPPEPELLGVQ
jgi:hypothetical protein